MTSKRISEVWCRSRLTRRPLVLQQASPHAKCAPKIGFAPDSPVEGDGFELVWGFSCQIVVLVCSRFFVRSGKAVLRPVACDQVRGARGRGQGTETLAKA